MKKLKNIIGIILIVIITNVIFFNYVNDDNKNLDEKAKTLNTSNVFQNLKNNSIQYFQNPDFTIAAEKTINSVVHVKNTSTARSRNSIWDLFYDNSPSKRTVGTGSGVIVSSDGYILTNYHVIENASEIEITTNNNKSFIAELIGTDENSDIAVLKISGDKKFPYIRFANSDETKIGEWVLAVGNPFNLTSTVTAGIISAKSRDLNDYDSKNQSFIQTDAAVNSGNSGGALVNISGDLIGINTAIQSNNAGFIGYSFAVPSNIARKIYEDILEFGNVQRGLLGVTGQSLNAEISRELDLKVTEGFYVSTTDEDMGAHLAGIRSGDIITKIDNVEIKKFSDLSGYLNSKRPGDQLSVDIFRDNKKINMNVGLKRSSYVQFYGMQLKDASKRLLDEKNLSHGVEVVVNRNGTLFRMGVRPGHILSEINDTKILSTSELSNFENENIYQITFIDENGEKERLIFE